MQPAKDILDFIIIGAQKAGTTSLFEYLRLHPEISLPASKEAPYFSHDSMYSRGWPAYMRKIAFADPQRKWGTVTTRYMAGGVTGGAVNNNNYDERTVPLRIRERLPKVRLIAILRDPVERAVSHHRMVLMDGREQRSFDDAVGELLRPDMLERARRHPRETTGYIVWGEYGRILAGYFDVFPREQILVVFTDELERAPAQLLRRIQEFIGVMADFEPPNLAVRYRAGAGQRRFSRMGPYASLSPQALQRVLRQNSVVRAVWDLIPEAGQRRLRRPYERFAYRVDLWNRRSGASADDGNSAQPSPATLLRLREHYVQDTGHLAALLEETPSWQTASEPR